ncbi:hypothetical protein AB833_19590 [Chromatiales bacterium (ex Bugula neritina AB1)]|nr:hypothetical protein AB833_19590 [Chromatiales bacterium (ex Bugula neritina AB1)]
MSTNPTSTDPAANLSSLIELIRNNSPALVLTGAGISTDSGIPAYRDQHGNWTQPQPVQAQDFRRNPQVRQRYWLRSMLGWPRFHRALTNPSHDALFKLEQAGIVSCVITQNVDGLHRKAGSKNVVELHGSLAQVICLSCGELTPRLDLQQRLEQSNSRFLEMKFNPAADGDATPVASGQTPDPQEFNVVSCRQCQGVLKPDVVFYGENVPSARVSYCMDQLDTAGLLLCIGTSLSVMSGYRFCRAAEKQSKPIAIVNQGVTRADDLTDLKVALPCASALQALCESLLQDHSIYPGSQHGSVNSP